MEAPPEALLAVQPVVIPEVQPVELLEVHLCQMAVLLPPFSDLALLVWLTLAEKFALSSLFCA